MAITKTAAELTPFVYVKDANTGKVTRVAFPGSVQIGMPGRPTSIDVIGDLTLNGRLTLATDVYDTARETYSLQSNVTLLSVIGSTTPPSGRYRINLPASPSEGEVHLIKDANPISATWPIDIYPGKAAHLIDGQAAMVLNSNYATAILMWTNGRWISMLSASSGGGGGGGGSSGGDPGAQYLVLSNTSSLSNERALSVGTGLLGTDGGANSSYALAINNNVVATVSGTRFTGATIHAAGLSGSLTKLSNGASYLVAGTNVTIVTSSNGQVTISSTGTGTSTGGGDPDAQYLVLANTASLSSERTFAPGTGLLASDGGANSSYTLSINNGVVATVSGTTFTGPVSASAGLSGSLQMIAPNLTYLAAGTNVTIVTSSNGQVTISSTATGGGGSGDPGAQYLVLANTSSLSNERAFSAGLGLLGTDTGANGTYALSINDNIVATVSGTTFLGPVSASAGLSGSLQMIAPNLTYLVAGANVTIASQSNGQVIVSAGSSGNSTSSFTGSFVIPITTFTNLRWKLNESGQFFANSGVTGSISPVTLTGSKATTIETTGPSGETVPAFLGDRYIGGGENQYLTGSFLSVSIWAKPGLTSTGWRLIFGKQYISGSHTTPYAAPFSFYTINTDTRIIEYRITTGAAAGTTLNPSETNLVTRMRPNQWNHIAMTYDGATVVCYLNGLEVNSVAKTGALYNGTGAWLIGGNPASSEYFSGSLCDARIEATCRSPENIRKEYESGIISYYVSGSNKIQRSLT